MKDGVGKLLDRIQRSNGSAFTIIEFVLEDIVRIAASGGADRERWKDLALGIASSMGRMAPLYNVANLILLSLEDDEHDRRILEEFKRVREHHSDSVDIIAKRFAEEFSPGTLMVNSYSATVKACLTELSRRRDVTVKVAESLPMGEGVMFADSLAAGGIECQIISDSMTFECMKKVDMFLCGADAVLPHKVYNKIGSRAMAHAARQEGKPTVVVCDTLKMVPEDVGDSAAKTIAIGPCLKRCSALFESFEASLVDRVITERWSCGPEDLREKFRTWKYSPLLDGMGR